MEEQTMAARLKWHNFLTLHAVGLEAADDGQSQPSKQNKRTSQEGPGPRQARKEEADMTQSGVNHAAPKAPPAQRQPSKEACLSAPGTKAVYQARAHESETQSWSICSTAKGPTRARHVSQNSRQRQVFRMPRLWGEEGHTGAGATRPLYTSMENYHLYIWSLVPSDALH